MLSENICIQQNYIFGFWDRMGGREQRYTRLYLCKIFFHFTKLFVFFSALFLLNFADDGYAAVAAASAVGIAAAAVDDIICWTFAIHSSRTQHTESRYTMQFRSWSYVW